MCGTKVYIGVAVVVIIIVMVAGIALYKKEGFTIAVRDNKLLCDPLVNHDEDYLMPHSVTFVIQGYNYAETPIIYGDDEKLIPLQYAWDYESMAYYITVDAPKGLCGTKWILETSDFVEPVVKTGEGKLLKVTLMRRRYRFNRWEISC
jgi:hypothetical protein